MVLQDVDTSSDSFSDNPYPSGNDPYASPPSGSRFDASSLPRPLPILGPLFGYSDAAVRMKVESTIEFGENRVGRRLTPEEAQALASHLYKLEQSKSYFNSIGAAAGVWRWYNTMGKSRYPFYQPKPEDINPNKFMFVRGPMAQYARHSWRFLIYTFVAGHLGSLVGQVVAQPVAAQDTAKDPKLAQFAADLKASISTSSTHNQGVKDETRKKWDDMIARQRGAKDSGESGRGDASLPRAPRTPRNIQKATPVDDDMSPTAGNDPWAPTSQDAWGDFDAIDPTPSAQATQRPIRPTKPTNTWGRRPTRSNDDDDDDASPTGGLFQDEVQSQSKPGESAWERLRRGQRPTSGKPETPNRERREGSTLGDSFTFTESDEERRREQSKAQREFDARIERERQGKDFNEEKRW